MARLIDRTGPWAASFIFLNVKASAVELTLLPTTTAQSTGASGLITASVHCMAQAQQPPLLPLLQQPQPLPQPPPQP